VRKHLLALLLVFVVFVINGYYSNMIHDLRLLQDPW
jgi:hypothetical protein